MQQRGRMLAAEPLESVSTATTVSALGSSAGAQRPALLTLRPSLLST